jgi:hypothetical protein
MRKVKITDWYLFSRVAVLAAVETGCLVVFSFVIPFTSVWKPTSKFNLAMIRCRHHSTALSSFVVGGPYGTV